MGINDWKSLLMGYLRDSGHKNPKALMSRHKDLLNYFYIKKHHWTPAGFFAANY